MHPRLEFVGPLHFLGRHEHRHVEKLQSLGVIKDPGGFVQHRHREGADWFGLTEPAHEPLDHGLTGAGAAATPRLRATTFSICT